MDSEVKDKVSGFVQSTGSDYIYPLLHINKGPLISVYKHFLLQQIM